MKKILGSILMVFFLASGVEAGKKPEQVKILVWVSVPDVPIEEETGGFVKPGPNISKGQKALEDSAKDFRKKVKKDDWLALAATEEEADLEVKIIARSLSEIEGVYSVHTYANYVEVNSMGTRSLVALVFADGEIVFTLRSDPNAVAMGGWGWRAGKLKDQLQEFVQANYDHILSTRE